MTPKEKAKELVSKYEFIYIQNYTSMYDVKRCAIIAVEEIIDGNFGDGYNHQFWECVKEEIENYG